MNNKIFTKNRPQGASPISLQSEYSSSNWFIAILLILTPGIILIQIVNTNVYLIHFIVKIIFIVTFKKLSFINKKLLKTSLYITLRWNKLRCHQQRRYHNRALPNLRGPYAEPWLAPLQVASATSAATFSVAPGPAPLLFKIYSAATILTTFKRCANR